MNRIGILIGRKADGSLECIMVNDDANVVSNKFDDVLVNNTKYTELSYYRKPHSWAYKKNLTPKIMEATKKAKKDN